ncbi:hypothetical protein B0H14DRAFT_3890416 [Mycena olivaceomarginata]|nr:hypothetical protein B0H14DRAFT_3890416 [Mycena olivaceomarginata]
MPLAARVSEGLCAPLAPTCLGCAHRSPRSNDVVVPRGAERLGPRRRCDCTRAALVIYGLGRRPPPWRRSDGSASRTPSAPRYFSARMSPGVSSSRIDWGLERVLSAIGPSVLEAPANPGMGTKVYIPARNRGMHDSAQRLGRPRLPPSPFDALLNGQRLYTAVSLRPPPHALYIALPYRQVSGSTTPRPFVNDTLHTHRGLINGRYKPRRPAHASPPC